MNSYYLWTFLLAFLPALIAESKGRRLYIWYIYGVLLLPVAVLHSIIIKDRY